MRIAVIGCVHGRLTEAYNAVQKAMAAAGGDAKLGCVIMCGDIQACRTQEDMTSMSVPAKYRQMGDFHEYYSGTRHAPYLTIVIGGNHEASSYMSGFHKGGGWLAPNIWYVGDSGIVEIDGVRIVGLSGIWYKPDFDKPRFEPQLFAADPVRAAQSDARFSVYHTRRSTIDELRKIGRCVDIVVSHDWPRGIENFGNTAKLIERKPWFKEDIAKGTLGNPATAPLLDSLRPQWWLSAHLHVRFTAKYKHTKFLALDKVLPRHKFLELIDVSPKHSDSEVRPAGMVTLR